MTGSPKSERPLLEMACFDTESAIVAWKSGADRVELCHGKNEGGTTPTLASIECVKRHVTIPVFVMIRPRGGDFVYSTEEFKQMQSDIEALKALIDGFVFGMLDQNGEVDVRRTSELVQRAGPLPCTFHRAFDEAKDLDKALEAVVSCGVRAVLSSGGKDNAIAGSGALKRLVDQAHGRVHILPGGGVRAENIQQLQEITGALIFHSSGISAGQSSIDADEVRRMKTMLRGEGPDGLPGVDESRSRHDSSQEDEEPVAEAGASATPHHERDRTP